MKKALLSTAIVCALFSQHSFADQDFLYKANNGFNVVINSYDPLTGVAELQVANSANKWQLMKIGDQWYVTKDGITHSSETSSIEETAMNDYIKNFSNAANQAGSTSLIGGAAAASSPGSTLASNPATTQADVDKAQNSTLANHAGAINQNTSNIAILDGNIKQNSSDIRTLNNGVNANGNYLAGIHRDMSNDETNFSDNKLDVAQTISHINARQAMANQALSAQEQALQLQQQQQATDANNWQKAGTKLYTLEQQVKALTQQIAAQQNLVDPSLVTSANQTVTKGSSLTPVTTNQNAGGAAPSMAPTGHGPAPSAGIGGAAPSMAPTATPSDSFDADYSPQLKNIKTIADTYNSVSSSNLIGGDKVATDALEMEFNQVDKLYDSFKGDTDKITAMNNWIDQNGVDPDLKRNVTATTPAVNNIPVVNNEPDAISPPDDSTITTVVPVENASTIAPSTKPLPKHVDPTIAAVNNSIAQGQNELDRLAAQNKAISASNKTAQNIAASELANAGAQQAAVKDSLAQTQADKQAKAIGAAEGANGAASLHAAELSQAQHHLDLLKAQPTTTQPVALGAGKVGIQSADKLAPKGKNPTYINLMHSSDAKREAVHSVTQQAQRELTDAKYAHTNEGSEAQATANLARKEAADAMALAKQKTPQNDVQAATVDYTPTLNKLINGHNENVSAISATQEAVREQQGEIVSNSEHIADNRARIIDDEHSNNERFANIDKRLSKTDSQVAANRKRAAGGISGVAAMATIPQVLESQNFALGAGVGTFDSAQAVAVGFSARATQHITVKASVSDTTNNDFAASAGFSYGW